MRSDINIWKEKIKLFLFLDERIVGVFCYCFEYIKVNILSIILCYSFVRFIIEVKGNIDIFCIIFIII